MILTDAQALAIVHATRPLQEHEQAAFLEALAALLAGRDTIGDGELGRVLRELQRQHFRPPTDTEIGVLDGQHKRTARAATAGRALPLFRAHGSKRFEPKARKGRRALSPIT
jgi:hypothetical protein